MRWAAEVLRVFFDEWVTLSGLGWARGCRVAPWVRGGHWGAVRACGGGGLWSVVFWGALMVSWMPADGDGGRVWGAE